MITTGTTIGEISTASTSPRSGKLARQRPIAAKVPSTVASDAAIEPRKRLFFSAWSQKGEVKKSSYQRSENPGSG
jgi:hypothetical protein